MASDFVRQFCVLNAVNPSFIAARGRIRLGALSRSFFLIVLQDGFDQPRYGLGNGGNPDVKAQFCCGIRCNRTDTGNGDPSHKFFEGFGRQKGFEIFDG